jgi:hypothetical protein
MKGDNSHLGVLALWRGVSRVIPLALVASCGGGDDHPAPAIFTVSAYEQPGELNGDDAFAFDLTQIVTNSTAGSTITYNNPTNGVVTAQTNSTQINYYDIIAQSPEILDICSMTLTGTFDIPESSLTNGNVAGTTGIVTAIMETCYGDPWFQVTGISVDAGSLINAIATADYETFWQLVGNRAASINAIANAEPGLPMSMTVYCSANYTGASIVITDAGTPIESLLRGC